MKTRLEGLLSATDFFDKHLSNRNRESGFDNLSASIKPNPILIGQVH